MAAALPVDQEEWLCPRGEQLQLDTIQAAIVQRQLMSTLIAQACRPSACSQVPEHCISRLQIWQAAAPSGAQASLNLLYRSAAPTWGGQASLRRRCLHIV